MPAEINYRNEKMPKKDFLAFQEDVHYKLSILEKKTPNPGFWANLKTVLAEPDQWSALINIQISFRIL